MEVNIELTLIPRLLQSLNAKDLVHQFRSIDSPSEASDLDITNALLKRIHAGVLPPLILTIWIPIVVHRTPGVLYQVIMDETSRGARQIGLSWLPYLDRKRFQSRDRAWEALGGGIKGLAQMLNFLPPVMTKRLAHTVGTNSVFKETIEPGKIDELAKGLLYEHFTTLKSDNSVIDASLRSSRPYMASNYMPLLHACQDDTLNALFSATEVAEDIIKYIPILSTTHSAFLRQIAVKRVQVGKSVYSSVSKIQGDLIASKAPYQPSVDINVDNGFVDPSKVHPGICFCVDLVSHINDEDTILPTAKLQPQVSALNNAIKRGIQSHTPFVYLFALLKFVVEKLHVTKTSRWTNAHSLYKNFAAFWSMARFPGLEYEPHIHGFLSVNHPSRPAPEDFAPLQELMISVFRKMLVPQPREKVSIDISTYRWIVELVPKAARLDFLKICILHTTEIDLDSELNAKDGPFMANLRVSERTLLLLPAADASWLLNKVLQSQHDDDKITAIIPLKYTREPHEVLTLIKIKLEANMSSADDTVKLARKAIKDFQKSADQAADPYTRSYQVNLALEAASATGSIKLLKSVLFWTDCFIRDSYTNVGSFDGVIEEVLSCVHPTETFKPNSLEDLSAMVNEANEIMGWALSLITKHQAYGLDDKFEYLARRTAQSFSAIISDRAQSINRLHLKGLGSVDQLQEILLLSQVPLLLQLEQKTTLLENEDKTIGLDGAFSDMLLSKFHGQHMLVALDKLASERNMLFQQHRLSEDPSLKDPEHAWHCQGLPVQHLCGNREMTALAMANPAKCPYITERFEAAIFCNPQLAYQPVDVEELDLDYVDSSVFAISEYINPNAIAFDLFKERLSKVWKHYSTSSDKVPWDLHRLKLVLYKAIESRDNIKATRHFLRNFEFPLTLTGPIPDSAVNTTENVSWNPSASVGVYDATLPHTNGFVRSGQDGNHHTALQILFLGTQDPDMSHLKDVRECQLNVKSKTTPEVYPVAASKEHPWMLSPSVSKASHLPLALQEALAISALLFLDQAFQQGAHPKLLEKEFPEDTISSRFPAVFLAEDFVNAAKDDLSKSIKCALDAVKSVVNIVPPQLLRKLAKSLLSRLAAFDHENEAVISNALSRATFGVIDLLDSGDQPQLAIDLAVDCAIDLPQFSTWHRSILSLDLDGSLTADNSANMIRRFSDLVIQSLRASREASRSKNKESEKADAHGENETDGKEKGKEPTPLKITTIKIIPEFLYRCQHLDIRSTHEILRNLSHNSVHIDVRSKILEQFIQLLGKSSSEDCALIPQLYDDMEFFRKLAAGPSERNLMTEGQWTNIEDGNEKFPEISIKRTLQDIFVNASLPKSQRAEYAQRMLVPLIRESIAMNTRWMQLFLKKITNLSKEEEIAASESFGPFEWGLIMKIWRSWFQFLHQEFLEIVQEHIAKPLHYYKLRHVSEKIQQKDPNYYNDKAARSFVDHIGRAQHSYSTVARTVTDTAFSKENDSAVEEGISLQDQLDLLHYEGDLVLQNPFSLTEKPVRATNQTFVSLFSDILMRRAETLELANVQLSVAEELLQNVKAKSTPEWLAMNPNSRTPCVLPPVTHLEKLLISARLKMYFRFENEDDGKYARVMEFAKDGENLLREHAERYPSSCIFFAREFSSETLSFHWCREVKHQHHDCGRAVLLELGSIPHDQHQTAFATSYIYYLVQWLEVILDFEQCEKDEEIKGVLRSWVESPNWEIRDHLLSSDIPQALYLDVVAKMA